MRKARERGIEYVRYSVDDASATDEGNSGSERLVLEHELRIVVAVAVVAAAAAAVASAVTVSILLHTEEPSVPYLS